MFNRYKSEQTYKPLLLWYLVTSTRKEVIYRGNTSITLFKKQEIRMTQFDVIFAYHGCAGIVVGLMRSSRFMYKNQKMCMDFFGHAKHALLIS